MRRSAVLTSLALLYLGLTSAVVGVWAQFFPRSFYNRFPGLGAWIAGDGPYNEHLIRDVGGLNLALAVLALLAWRAPGWISARAVGLAALVFGVPHLIYHLFHLHTLPTHADRVNSVTGLLLAVVAPLWLLGQPRVERRKR